MGGWWAPCFTEPAHRLNFEVGGEPVTFQDANLRNRRQAELSRFQNSYKSDLCSTLLQLLSERNSFKPGQGDSQAFGKSGKEDLVQVASYLAMGGTLDGDQLLSPSAWQVTFHQAVLVFNILLINETYIKMWSKIE